MKDIKEGPTFVIVPGNLPKYSVDTINNSPYNIIIDLYDTKGISLDFLARITNPKVKFHISDKDNRERCFLGEVKNAAPEVTMETDDFSYLAPALTYTKDELEKIIAAMEDIEKNIKDNWSPMKKALYVYKELRERLIYKYTRVMNDHPIIRTLRGLIYDNCVCAGYALIFKEIMTRENIPCEYVLGTTTMDDFVKSKNTHAWNLLIIDGKSFPLDLTFDSSRYHQGKEDSYENFANNLTFPDRHYPALTERLLDYGTLYGLKKEYITKVVRQFDNKKNYLSKVLTLYEPSSITRIIQLDRDEDQDTFCYILINTEKGQGRTRYQKVYSENNLFGRYIDRKVKKSEKVTISDHDEELYRKVIKMFNFENVRRICRDGSNYLGGINDQGEYSRNKLTELAYPKTYDIRERNDGTRFLIDSEGIELVEGIVLHKFSIIELNAFKNKLVKYEVTSENNLLEDKRDIVTNRFLNRERIDYLTNLENGYLGSCNAKGDNEYNRKLLQYFDKDSPMEVTKEDLIEPGFVRKLNPSPLANSHLIKKLVLKNNVNYNERGQVKITDRKDNSPVDTQEYIDTLFSYSWILISQRINNDTSFSEILTNYKNRTYASELSYFQKRAIEMIEDQGFIDYSELGNEDMVKNGYAPSMYIDNILKTLKSSSTFQEVAHDFFNSRVSYYKNKLAATNAKNRGYIKKNEKQPSKIENTCKNS